jgi:hypothetical protein
LWVESQSKLKPTPSFFALASRVVGIVEEKNKEGIKCVVWHSVSHVQQ